MNQNNNNTFSANIPKLHYITTIFTIIDIIATAIIGTFTLLAPNLTVTTFKKEPTIVVLGIIIIIMLLLSARPFIQRTAVTLIRLFITGLITLFIMYVTFSFLQWYLYNPEGVFNFRFISFAKKASLDEKISYYMITVHTLLDAIYQQDVKLAKHLLANPIITTPSKDSLMRTAYTAIPALAEANIAQEIREYDRMLNAISSTISVNASSSNTYFYIKCGLAAVGIIATIAIVYYCFSGDSKLAKLATAVEQTQENLLKKSAVIQDHSKAFKVLHEHGMNINEGTGVMLDTIQAHAKLLKSCMSTIQDQQETILALETQVTNLTNVINHTIRPIMRMMFNSNDNAPFVKPIYRFLREEVKNPTASKYLQDQLDFISNVSKIIFK